MELVVIRGDEQSGTDLTTTERNYSSEPDDESGNDYTKGI